MRAVKHLAVPVILLPLMLAPEVLRASETAQFQMVERFRIESGETLTDDVYLLAGETRVAGVLEGDLVAWTARARITGEVTGDVIVGTQSLEISGRVGDSVRAFAAETTIDGVVDGDLIVFSGMVNVHEDAHITGNLIACAGNTNLAGTVDGRVTITGGEVTIGGTLGRDAHIEADVVTVLSGSRIGGDLTHSSREFDLREGALIEGETILKEKPKEEKGQKDGITFFGVVWWIWGTLSAILVGLLLVALFRRLVPAVTRTIGGETLTGALIGFGAFLVVPAASLLALLFLPLGLICLALFLVAVYVAKMPVAVWLGGRLLGLLGSDAPSPYLAVALGLVLLRLCFLIPYLGTLLWLVAIWLGLGAMILVARSHLQRQESRPATR